MISGIAFFVEKKRHFLAHLCPFIPKLSLFLPRKPAFLPKKSPFLPNIRENRAKKPVFGAKNRSGNRPVPYEEIGISSEVIAISSEEIRISSEEKPFSSEFGEQRKEKEYIIYIFHTTSSPPRVCACA